MKVRQRVYFLATSDALTPEEISAHLGMMADLTSLRGSKRLGPPPLPRRHLWELRSLTPENARLDEQITALLDRLSPMMSVICSLAADGKIDIGIQVVRYFDPGPEDEAVLKAREDQIPLGLTILGGQHPRLGFHLGAEDIARLAALGVSIDFDEYGDEYE
jgi:hypothetical protein